MKRGKTIVENTRSVAAIDLCADTAVAILQNGGEVFRVEETINHMCRSFGFEDIQPFCLSHGVFLSAKDKSGVTYTRIRSVPTQTQQSHFGRVAAINELSRKIEEEHLDVGEARRRFDRILQISDNSFAMRLIASGIATGAISISFGANLLEMFLVAVTGMMTFSIPALCAKYSVTKPLVYITGGFTVILVSFVLNAIFSNQNGMSIMVTCGIMPLIPGLAFVNSVRDVVDGHFLAGIVKLLDSMLGFVYIAVGIVFGLSVFRIWWQL